ncbi:MAG: hypothetical protein ACKVH7_04645, partial [Alphaproteobacteria bacterium]
PEGERASAKPPEPRPSAVLRVNPEFCVAITAAPAFRPADDSHRLFITSYPSNMSNRCTAA